jgi:plasmid stabilization system protein ParE
VAEYAITFARSARKQLQVLDRALALRVLGRIRVGDYRVIYEIDDDRRRVDVSAVRHRRDAYR